MRAMLLSTIVPNHLKNKSIRQELHINEDIPTLKRTSVCPCGLHVGVSGSSRPEYA